MRILFLVLALTVGFFSDAHTAGNPNVTVTVTTASGSTMTFSGSINSSSLSETGNGGHTLEIINALITPDKICFTNARIRDRNGNVVGTVSFCIKMRHGTPVGGSGTGDLYEEEAKVKVDPAKDSDR